MEGFVLLHRTMLEWEWYGDINTKTLFIHFLLRANHKDGYWKGISVSRGSFITSVGTLEKETGLSTKQIRLSISKLEKSGEVGKRTTSYNTVISVLNYDLYQTVGQTKRTKKGKPRANEGQLTNNDNNIDTKVSIEPLTVWLNKNCLNVQSMDFPITDDQAKSIVESFPDKKAVSSLFDEMDNWKGLKVKNTSAYKTFLAWVRKRQKDNPSFGEVPTQMQPRLEDEHYKNVMAQIAKYGKGDNE